MNIESIYLMLPIWAQNLAVCAEGYRINKSRYSAQFKYRLAETIKRTSYSLDEIQQYRNERLTNFIQHSFHTVPYYRRKFREWGIDPSAIRSLEDLSEIPVLSKAEVQDNIADFISDIVPRKQLIISHTSGTTGTGLRFATTLGAIQEQWAVWWRYRNWHGIDFDTWCGYFAGRSVVAINQTNPPFWRYNYPGKQIIFSGYHMNEENMGSYHRELNKRKPLWLHGYPSLLALLASYFISQNKSLDYNIQWITTGAENLLPHQADMIYKAFGVWPVQHYGQAEGIANISQCEVGNLHVDEDFSAVEFIPYDDNNSKIIGTNFSNYATPLLRYDVQDLAQFSKEKCACGRPGRLVKRLDGRLEDYIILRNGARVGRLDHIFKDLVMIREAQIFQERPGQIELRVVKREGYNQDDEKRLVEETYKRLGDVQVEIKYLDVIERTGNGKLRFVISRI